MELAQVDHPPSQDFLLALRATGNGQEVEPAGFERVVFRGPVFVLQSPTTALQPAEQLWFIRTGHWPVDLAVEERGLRLWVQLEPKLGLGRLLQVLDRLSLAAVRDLAGSLWPATGLHLENVAQLLNASDTESVELPRVRVSLLLSNFGVRCTRLAILDTPPAEPIDRQEGLELRLGVPAASERDPVMPASASRRPSIRFVWSQVEADRRLKDYLQGSLRRQESLLRHRSVTAPVTLRIACHQVERQVRHLLDLLATLPAFDAGPRGARPGFWESEEFLRDMEEAVNSVDTLQSRLEGLTRSRDLASELADYKLECAALEQLLTKRRKR